MSAELYLFLMLFLGGAVGHLLMRVSGDLGVYIYRGLNRRGEVGTDGDAGKAGAGDGKAVKFDADQQKQVDSIVESRLKREREKYSDYEDLRKFKTEFEKQQDAKAQKDLEEQRKYEDAKKGYETQLNQHKEALSKKDSEIIDLRISHNLVNEITRHNGYTEEALALLKSSAVLNSSGSVVIKSKDANGLDVELPVAEGVKRFLEARPYLVKSTHKAGAGTTAANGSVGSNAQAEDHNSLNKDYMDAINRGDFKKSKELKTKINAVLAAKGVSV